MPFCKKKQEINHTHKITLESFQALLSKWLTRICRWLFFLWVNTDFRCHCIQISQLLWSNQGSGLSLQPQSENLFFYGFNIVLCRITVLYKDTPQKGSNNWFNRCGWHCLLRYILWYRDGIYHDLLWYTISVTVHFFHPSIYSGLIILSHVLLL